jgi:hypothetical protein
MRKGIGCDGWILVIPDLPALLMPMAQKWSFTAGHHNTQHCAFSALPLAGRRAEVYRRPSGLTVLARSDEVIE